MNINTIKVVSSSQIIPPAWGDLGFWEELTDNVDWCFGNNAYSLVSAKEFLEWMLSIVNEDYGNTEIESVSKTLSFLTTEKVYIDLES